MAASNLNILYKTPLGETGCICNPYFYLLVAYASSFFYSSELISINTVSLGPYGYIPITVQHLCDLRDTMPRHWSLDASQGNPR